jgi:hypothetical protein
MRVADFRKCDNVVHTNQSSSSDIRAVSIRDRGEFTFPGFHVSSIGVYSEQNHDIAVDQTMIECSLFRTNEELSAMLGRVRSPVLIAVIPQFVSELEKSACEITDGNFAGFFNCTKSQVLKNCG